MPKKTMKATAAAGRAKSAKTSKVVAPAKRGRPPKAKTGAAKAEKTTAAKRGPGRPKGAMTLKPGASVLSETQRQKLRKKAAASVQLLSPAERVVYDLMCQGMTAKAIGKALGRSSFTISNHTRRIFEAFGLNSRSAIIAMLVVPLDAE